MGNDYGISRRSILDNKAATGGIVRKEAALKPELWEIRSSEVLV